MKNLFTSIHGEQEESFLVPGKHGIDWKATKVNFVRLTHAAYLYTLFQCEKYVINDDMRDPDATIQEVLKDNIEPILAMLDYYEEQGMPIKVSKEIRKSTWLNKKTEDVICDLSPEARKMRKRKINLRKRWERLQTNRGQSSQEKHHADL